MIAVVQRVSEASVSIEGKINGQIGQGLLILLGIGEGDGQEDIEWLVGKLVNLRIFSDKDDKMNLSCKDVAGGYLVISQFTLHASTKKGNRPSFIQAARPEVAIPLYQQFVDRLEAEAGRPIATGQFGADMKVSLVNDGPVTIHIDTQNKK
ncbi:MAG: D-aminoacyl-tRNA deacylase [Cyclobacteriaceae bacterium]|nr:D-aminoacyl-tRNA deacylase [Cyclobacteriaceae bacterium]